MTGPTFPLKNKAYTQQFDCFENARLLNSSNNPDRSFRLHLKNEPGQQIPQTNVPTIILENISSFLQNCSDAQSSVKSSPIDWLYGPPNSSSNSSRPEILRMKARDLIQQERCDSNFSYAVDQPSKLVRIECLKTGCKCVLKQESALALKIVCGVSLVRGHWSTLPPPTPAKWGSISSAFERLQPGRNPGYREPHQQNSSSSDQHSSFQSSEQIPLILTSCSPFWFELLKKPSTNHNEINPSLAPSIPTWNSGKAVWRVRPQMFLLRKQTKCILSVAGRLENSNDLKPGAAVSLYLDNTVHLHPGTVLRLLDCKTCRLVTTDPAKSSLHFPTAAAMLQCEVVGAKSLAKYAASAVNLSPEDALYWFSGGPRLVYLPLDDKTVSFCPIATPPPNSRESKHSNSSNWPHSGAHSTLSLLSNFQLPISVRPVMDHSLANWLTSSQAIRDGNAGLILNSCYHGDLVFLEPISDCAEHNDPQARGGVGCGPQSSRFFVVTAEMLSQHRFIVASPASSQAYSRELKTHASRVAHFLAAFHPAFGLNYLLKYLEDVTHCSSVGPMHKALTETLGPAGEGTAASHTAIASIAASMTLHTSDYDPYRASPSSSSSHKSKTIDNDHLNTLYNDLDDIYQYVRTGKFPKNGRKEVETVISGRVTAITTNNIPDPLQMHIRLRSTPSMESPRGGTLSQQRMNLLHSQHNNRMMIETNSSARSRDYTVPYLYFAPPYCQNNTASIVNNESAVKTNLVLAGTSPVESGFYQQEETIQQVKARSRQTPHAYEYPNMVPSTPRQLQRYNNELTRSPSKRLAYQEADLMFQRSCGYQEPVFRTIEQQLYPPNVANEVPPVQKQFGMYMNERTNSSPDTGLGAESGQSSVPLLQPHSTSIVRSSCQQLLNFCRNSQDEANLPMSHNIMNRRLNSVTVNLNKRIV